MSVGTRAREVTLAFSLGVVWLLGSACDPGDPAVAELARPVIQDFPPSERFPNGHFEVSLPGGELEGAFELWVLEPDEALRPTGRRARLSDGRLAPPVLGKLHQTSPLVLFEPRFPLQPGTWYEGVFTPRDGSSRTKSTFMTPLVDSEPSTFVTAVYPSASILPENLLRFYVQFSGPMRRGEAYEHARLFDAAGDAVEGVFLAIRPELWDPEATRLTLLLDPGRIKRGLALLEEVGPNLREGASYTLRIDSGWRDAAGRRLSAGLEKTFTVGAPDRVSPDSATWVIVPAPGGTREPLRVEFDEPLDHALLQRMLFVEDQEGRVVNGLPRALDEEHAWEWDPDEEWGTGAHVLIVDPLLEDRAGNGLRRLFDDAAEREAAPDEGDDLRLPFEVPPPTTVD